MNAEQHAESLVETGKKLVKHGLVTGSFGNASLRLPDQNLVLVTPSGMDYERMTVDDLVTIDMDGNKVQGKHKPTSEAPMHLAIYASRQDVHSIIHTHSPFATTLACAELPIPPVHYLMAGIGGTVPLARFATFGTREIGEEAAKALGQEFKAVLLAKHGVIAVGTTLEDTFFVAETVEYVASIYCRLKAMQIEITTLTEEQQHATNQRFYKRNQ